MTNYSVQELACMAGVSVRTLHHYDRIGLLKPAYRSEKGYRYYGRRELERLQHILFYRELDFPLRKIAELLNNPAFDRREALCYQRTELHRRAERLNRLIATLDATLNELQYQRDTMSDMDLYKGFAPEKVESIRAEVRERWGAEELHNSEERVRALGKQGWQDAQAEHEDVCRVLAELMEYEPWDEQVQRAIERHYRYIGIFYEVSEERYRGLGRLYVDDPRFTAFYDKYRTGLADFIRRAIEVFCDNGMQVDS